MSPNFDEHLWDSCRKHICAGKEEIKSSDTNLLGFSENCSGLSTISDICAGVPPKTDGSTYKRRKLYGNTVALLSEESKTCTKLSAQKYNLSSDDNHCTEIKDKGNLLKSGQHCLISPLEVVPNCIPNNICIIREEKLSVKVYNSDLEKSAKKHSASLNGSCSSTKGNVECSSASVNMKTEVKGTGESSDAVREPFGEFVSAKDLCVYVLKSNGLLGGERNPSTYPSEFPCPSVSSSSQPCKICGCLEDPLKMLICDLCEEAFHPSCCNPKVKESLVDDWYCQPCFRKKPKPLLQTSTERSFNIKDGNYGHRKLSYGDLISIMLKDSEGYDTGVRIGKDFQVDLPDWSGPSSIDHDYFGEPSEMDLTKFPNLNVRDYNKSNSIGNWIQCREVIDTDENGQQIICGKWRRAPLFVLQTEDWDCSCAVTWDPVHADCAVPQELATSEVLKQLKFVEKVNECLAARKFQKAKEPWPSTLGDSSKG